MRHETIVKTYATFSELDEAQKSAVVDKLYYINVDHHDWAEYTLDDRKEILTLLGFSDIKIQWSGFSCQGDGASFTGKFNVPANKKELKARLAKVKAMAPGFKLFDFTDMRFDESDIETGTLEVHSNGLRYSHSGSVTSDNADLTAFVRDFSDQLYKDLEKEHDYLTSREAIVETIEANDYEFDLETLRIA